MVFDGDVRAVNETSLEVPAGEIVSLIGPSGCGKTTLLRVMAGLQPATDGEVILDPPARGDQGDIAFVFQQPSLLPWRTALENVMLALELTDASDESECRSLAMQMLKTVHLQDAADRTPSQLSGGMKMRVSIARALVTRPRLLLLDEPFAALDDMLRHELGELLLNLWQDLRFTAVLVTHNIAESIILSHKIAVMHHGFVTQWIDNPLPVPRTEALRRTPEFGDFYGRVSDALRSKAGTK